MHFSLRCRKHKSENPIWESLTRAKDEAATVWTIAENEEAGPGSVNRNLRTRARATISLTLTKNWWRISDTGNVNEKLVKDNGNVNATGNVNASLQYYYWFKIWAPKISNPRIVGL